MNKQKLRMIVVCILFTSCGSSQNQADDSLAHDQIQTETEGNLKTKLFDNQLIYILDSPEYKLGKSNLFLEQISNLKGVSVINDTAFFHDGHSKKAIDYVKIQTHNYVKPSEIVRYEHATATYILTKGGSEYELGKSGAIQTKSNEIDDSLRCVIEVCPSRMTIGSSFFELFYVLKAIHPEEKIKFLENTYLLSFADSRQTYDSLSAISSISRNTNNSGKVIGCGSRGEKIVFKGTMKYEKGKYLSTYFLYEGYSFTYDEVALASH